MINNEISLWDFITITNAERNYNELKENTRMTNSQRSDIEKTNLIEEGNKIGINEIMKHNGIINYSLKFKI